MEVSNWSLYKKVCCVQSTALMKQLNTESGMATTNKAAKGLISSTVSAKQPYQAVP